ncbi:MAG TPA: CBS domain-containing protein [Gammaproteobacteria bacterium]|nr:CBS domain-containing protein [Gammaproteobacteria bacterium]
MDKQSENKLMREDFAKALREMNTFLDITADDLMELNRRAAQHARQRARESVPVSQLMTTPVTTVRADCSLAEAAHLLVEKRISGLPVVDREDRLIGLVTEADFLRAMGLPSHQPHHSVWQTLESLFQHQDRVRDPEGTVADLMIPDVVTVRAEHTLHEALDIMKKHRIKRLVVADEERRVQGIITRSDLVRVFFDRIRKSSDTSD